MRFKSGQGTGGVREDGQERRAHLLAAAERLFSRQGMAATTTRAIAAAAGCNIAAIRYYFGDKDGLFAAVIERTIGRVIEGGAHPVIDPTGDPRAELKRWIIWVLRTGQRRQRTSGMPAAMLMQGLAAQGPLARRIAQQLGAPVRENILALVDQLSERRLPPDVREHAFVFIFSLCSQFAQGGPAARNMGICVPEDDAGLNLLAERLTNFVVGGIATMSEFAAGDGVTK